MLGAPFAIRILEKVSTRIGVLIDVAHLNAVLGGTLSKYRCTAEQQEK